MKTDYACEGCGEMSMLQFVKPSHIGRVVARLQCSHCGSISIMHIKRIKHTKQVGIALINFRPGAKATKRMKEVKPDPAVIMP